MNVKDINIRQTLWFPVKDKRWKYPRIYSGCVRKIVIEALYDGGDTSRETIFFSTETEWFQRPPRFCFPHWKEAEAWLAKRIVQIKEKAIADKKRSRKPVDRDQKNGGMGHYP